MPPRVFAKPVQHHHHATGMADREIDKVQLQPFGGCQFQVDPPGRAHTVLTGILPILACQVLGPSMWALVPPASTATVTGMSTTSNS